MRKREKTRNPNRDARSHSEAAQLDRIEETLRALTRDIADLKAAVAGRSPIRPGYDGVETLGGDDDQNQHEPDPPN